MSPPEQAGQSLDAQRTAVAVIRAAARGDDAAVAGLLRSNGDPNAVYAALADVCVWLSEAAAAAGGVAGAAAPLEAGLLLLAAQDDGSSDVVKAKCAAIALVRRHLERTVDVAKYVSQARPLVLGQLPFVAADLAEECAFNVGGLTGDELLDRMVLRLAAEDDPEVST